jgi:hypothetical protein
MCGAGYDEAFGEMVLRQQTILNRSSLASRRECSHQHAMKHALIRQIDAAAEGLQAKGSEKLHAFFGAARVAKRPELNTEGRSGGLRGGRANLGRISRQALLFFGTLRRERS